MCPPHCSEALWFWPLLAVWSEGELAVGLEEGVRAQSLLLPSTEQG